MAERSEALASEAREACRALGRRTAGVWGRSPQRGPGAEPRWGVRGAKPPGNFFEKLRCFGGPESNSSNRNMNKIDVKFSRKSKIVR